MEKKIKSHLLIIGTILLHTLIIILSPSSFLNSFSGYGELNIPYNIAIDAVLVLFIFLLVSKSWKMIVPYIIVYELSTIIALGPLKSAAGLTIPYDILSALIYLGVIAIVQQIYKDILSKLNLKIILLITLISAVSNSLISPGIGFRNNYLNFQIAALFLMTIAAWAAAKQSGQTLSLKDTGIILLIFVILPLLKKLVLFFVLGFIGIDSTDIGERVNLIYGVDLVISILIAYMVLEPMLKPKMVSPLLNPAFQSMGAMPSVSSGSNSPAYAVTLQILQQVQALQSSNPQERSAAVLALSEINDPRVPEILRDVYETSPDMFSRMLAMNALEKRGIKIAATPVSINAENTTNEIGNQTGQTKTLDDYVRQLIELRKGCSSTSFFLGANQPENLMGLGEEIAENFGTRGLEYVTQKIRSELKTSHPYDGRELESAWEDIWMEQKMNEG